MNSFVSKNSIVGIGQSIANLINPKGIDVQSAVTNSTVNLNNITGVRYYSTNGYGGKGIDINTTIAASNLNIVENTISDISGDGWSTLSSDAIVGIRVLSTSISVTGGVNIWNNTVNLFGSIARSGGNCRQECMFVYSEYFCWK
ncbi:MAG: hypothetical protein IPO94_18280 [Saprospiraceae bacterium]|nr:hypothetical protein [Saprospiraceae bacterium]